MRHWKKFLALSLGLTLVFGQTAYAEVVVPPISEVGGAQGSNAGTLPGASAGIGVGTLPGPSVGGGAGTLPGPSVGDGVGTLPGPSVGTGSAGGASVAGTSETAGHDSSGTAAKSQEPEVSAEGAVLLDAATGKVLYGKNQNQQFYPASITKVMTALVVLERCNLNDKVTFSSTATTNLESGAVSLNISEGDVLTVEQCLYGLLLKSANEIGNGLAEHVAGSVSGFADLMNAKAKELGCRNTHFANPHGLNDSTHKTTPYDMALIMRAALQNATFRKIDTTTSYEFPAVKKSAARTITMGHKMMYPTDSRYYEGIIGGKTGYTSLAGNTLVTGVERNGVRLIAVVMKAKSTQYTDTTAMLDYGFGNYAALTGSGNMDSPSVPAGNQNPAPGTAGSQPGTSGPQPGTVGSQPGTSGSQAEVTGVPGTAGSQPGTSDSQAEAAGLPGTSASQAGTGWKQDATGWYYLKPDGSRAAGEWQTIGGYEYWFDKNAYMATGWRKFTNGDWYYFSLDDGHLVSGCWVQDGGEWYYLGADGVLLTNAETPDGRRVDENGILVQ